MKFDNNYKLTNIYIDVVVVREASAGSSVVHILECDRGQVVEEVGGQHFEWFTGTHLGTGTPPSNTDYQYVNILVQ